jgi:VanZ family protein
MTNAIRWLESKPKVACNFAVFYAGMIFILSSMRKVPRPPGPWYMTFVIHFIEYVGLGFLVITALRSRKARGDVILLSIAVAALYGASDELHQYFIPGRVADFRDFLFDSLGSAAGVFSQNILRRL